MNNIIRLLEARTIWAAGSTIMILKQSSVSSSDPNGWNNWAMCIDCVKNSLNWQSEFVNAIQDDQGNRKETFRADSMLKWRNWKDVLRFIHRWNVNFKFFLQPLLKPLELKLDFHLENFIGIRALPGSVSIIRRSEAFKFLKQLRISTKNDLGYCC